MITRGTYITGGWYLTPRNYALTKGLSIAEVQRRISASKVKIIQVGRTMLVKL